MGFLHLGKRNNTSLKLNLKSLRDGISSLEEHPYSWIIEGLPWYPSSLHGLSLGSWGELPLQIKCRNVSSQSRTESSQKPPRCSQDWAHAT